MTGKSSHPNPNLTEAEVGTVYKARRGRTRVALVYPNRYHVGMSNLGFQTIYALLNGFDGVVCERAFWPADEGPAAGRWTTLESGQPVADADIIAFSISFENDYPYLLAALDQAGLPLYARDRHAQHPLVIAGGVACLLNPEPIAAFIDCFLIGEAEALLPRFLEVYASEPRKQNLLETLARTVPGAYVPALYRPAYNRDGTLRAFEPTAEVPAQIQRVYVQDLSHASTCSAIITPYTTFDQTYLIEVGRGCPHGCRFCSAGFIYRPPRFRPVSLLARQMEQGLSLTDRIGLVGAAVSDLPDLPQLCRPLLGKDVRLSFSSLRADGLAPELLDALRQSNVKTATIAPDAGSERMRQVINKGLTEDDILNAAETLVANGIPNLKLYFMVGLPTETEGDVEAIVGLCKKIKHHFLKSSRVRQHIGAITVSLNSFVPKPVTPFQWVPMEEVGLLKKKIRKVKNALKKVANLRIHSDVPRWAYVQALLSRGDRKVADILVRTHANRGNWPQTLKSVSVNPDFYVHRDRAWDERLPWDFIDHGIKKSFLRQEYQRALQGLTTPVCRVESCQICGVCDPERSSQNLDSKK
ncbi:MAG: radical SAM protein [Desulfobacterales bacterium]|nr:MAG: radical SAM protein [Desulfobacterales bacterium]